MIETWEEYNKEIETRKQEIRELEIKILNKSDPKLKKEIHEKRNKFTVWTINSYMDLEEKYKEF